MDNGQDNNNGQKGDSNNHNHGLRNKRKRRRRPARNRNQRSRNDANSPQKERQEKTNKTVDRKRVNQNKRRKRRSKGRKHLINFQVELEKSTVEFRNTVKTLKERDANCRICGEKISDMLTSLLYKDNNEYCHFECVQNEIKKAEEIAKDEQMIYMGNGDFGIIQKRRSRGRAYFFVRKRITYRDKGSPHKVHQETPLK